MLDMTGKELHLGDEVASHSGARGNCYFKVCTVVDFGPKTAIVEDANGKRTRKGSAAIAVLPKKPPAPLWEMLGFNTACDHHPQFTRTIWKNLVCKSGTQLGYWEWVKKKVDEVSVDC